MDRILVGNDGSPAAQEALRWSADLVSRAGLELTAARVFVPTQAELDPQEYDSLRDDQLRDLERSCEEVASGGKAARAVLVDGEPADALLRATAEEEADMLVVGGRGGGGFTGLHLGSVAHHLIHHTTLPLAVVPLDAGDPVRRLVVGVDGSPGSEAAVGVCAELAARLEVPVTALFAAEQPDLSVPERDTERLQEWFAQEARKWADPIERRGVEVEVTLAHDMHPVDAIGRALEDAPGAVGVVGARGLGGFVDLRLGRVPLQLVHHTSRPVIVVPPTGG
ncbi:MAG: universal stress protein [Microthrixaceae bacterium]